MLQNKFGPVEDFSSTTQNPPDSDVDSGLADIQARPGSGRRPTVEDESLSDVVAALVSAILALTFLILLFCVVQVIKKRRRQRQGERLNQPVVHTISPGAFTASAAAYSQHVPTAGRVSWERVDSGTRSGHASIPRNLHRLDPAQLSAQTSDRLSPGVSSASPYETLSSSLLTHHEASNSRSQRNLVEETSQGTASSAPLSLQMVRVDAVLHHMPSPEVVVAAKSSSSSSHVTGWSDESLPSLPPPVFGSSYQLRQTSAPRSETQDLLGDDLRGATGGTDSNVYPRSVRTAGHRHTPSQ